MSGLMFKDMIHILGVSNSVSAEEFYCGKLGLEQSYAHPPAPNQLDPCYMGLSRYRTHTVVSSSRNILPGQQSAQIYVEDVAALDEDFSETVSDSIQADDFPPPEILPIHDMLPHRGLVP